MNKSYSITASFFSNDYLTVLICSDAHFEVNTQPHSSNTAQNFTSIQPTQPIQTSRSRDSYLIRMARYKPQLYEQFASRQSCQSSFLLHGHQHQHQEFGSVSPNRGEVEV